MRKLFTFFKMTAIANQMDLIFSTEPDLFTTFVEHTQAVGPFQETLTDHFKECVVTFGVIMNIFGILSNGVILAIIYMAISRYHSQNTQHSACLAGLCRHLTCYGCFRR